MQLSDKKLKSKFNRFINEYRNWCNKRGFNSREDHVLIWFFNRKGKAIKIYNQYFIKYQDHVYDVNLLIKIFKNGG